MPTTPILLVEIYLAEFPVSLGTTTLRFAKRPVSQPGRFYQPRLKGISPVLRACTDPDGNYQVGHFSVTVNNEDGELSELLSPGTSTEHWLNREMAAWIISAEGLASGLTIDDVPPIARGWITEVQMRRRDVEVTASDALGSQMSRFNLDKKVLQIAIRDLVPSTATVRPESKDVFLPIYLGEFSDRGDGTPGRGLVPCYEVCEIDITQPSDIPEPRIAPPPVITDAHVVGPGGGATYHYAVSLLTPYGESGLSNIVTVFGCPGVSELNVGSYVEISGTYQSDNNANGVRVWGRSTNPPTAFLDAVNLSDPVAGTWGYLDGAANYPAPFRDEVDIEKPMEPPATSTAVTNTNIFSVMAICQGYSYDIFDVFASDLKDGGDPTRTIIMPAEHGVIIITPDDPQWPFPNAWFDLTGIVFTGFLMRGPKVNHHREGTVTIAANICGPNDLSDLLVNQAFPQLQFLLNEYALKNKGTGRRNEVYGTLEAFENGDPIIKTSSFDDCQDLTKEWLGNPVGYIGAIWIDDPEETWRDVMQKFCVTYGSRLAPNRFGQMTAILVDTIARLPTGRHFREMIEIKRSEESRMAYDEIYNRFTMSYFFDVDAQVYRGTGLVFSNLESIAAHIPGGVVGGLDLRGVKEADRELAYTNDQVTAYDVINRELLRRKRRPNYQTETVPMLGLDHDLGEICRLTDSQGVRYDDTPMLILEHVVNADDQEVTLTLQDLRSVTLGTNESVGDNTDASSHEVGDNASIPPTSREVG